MKILIIDYQDNLLFNMMLAVKDEDNNCEFFHAASLPEAVNMLKQNQIEAVITDFIIPRGSSMELLKEICSLNPGVKAIVTYSNTDLRQVISISKGQCCYYNDENSIYGDLPALLKKLNRKITETSGDIIMMQLKRNNENIYNA